MNKTLLLIICDFLLLNLLALTRWERVEPPRAMQAPVPELAANAVTKEQDLVETMRLSLADEQTQREQLAEKLNTTDAALAAREQSLAAAQAERAKLAATVTESQRNIADLGKRFAIATQEATMTKEQLAQLQRELAEKQAEAERQKLVFEQQLEVQKAEAQKQIGSLTMAVVVSEQEKKDLREKAETLQTQVAVERGERAKAQETASQLAQGVGQLAEKSGELTKEIRDSRPINANVLFNEFLANRVSTTFAATHKGFLGPVNRTKTANTVLVTDGRQIYALLHVADTVFSFSENGDNWEKFSIEFARPSGYRSTAGALQFLAHDPRVIVIPVETSQAAALGAKVYPLAAEPFKFPDAVLINGGGKGYGEVGFKLEAAEQNFVRVDNRFFKRLFGDFAPSRGDLVFSKTGELLGIMVNSDYCALLKDFTPLGTIRTGDDILAQQTGPLLDSLSARVLALPLKLQ
jgi:X-X-X-Leu-X-X-Gly heptad repeat protein